MEFAGKNIVITGASSGIGLSLMKKIIENNNCNICAILRDDNKIKRMKQIYGDKIKIIKCDMKYKEQIDEMFEKLFTKSDDWSGSVDIFISSAGYAYYEKIDKPDWKHIEDIFTVNVFATIYCLELMTKYCNGKTFQYVPIASGLAKIAMPGYALYSSTKHALEGFVRAYNNEKDENIILSTVYPVAVKTPFYENSSKEMVVPLLRQNRERNTNNILNGIIHNRKYIYPSPLYKIYLIFRNFVPLTMLYTKVEKFRFDLWSLKN